MHGHRVWEPKDSYTTFFLFILDKYVCYFMAPIALPFAVSNARYFVARSSCKSLCHSSYPMGFLMRRASSNAAEDSSSSSSSPAFTINTATNERLLASRTGNGMTNDARRPMSPHLTIYALQLTNVLSITFRLCGAGLALLMYGIGIASAASILSVAGVVKFLGVTLPTSAFWAAKLAIGTPFFYHFYNGLRHLAWDLGYGLTLRGVYVGGYSVLLATAASTLASLFL